MTGRFRNLIRPYTLIRLAILPLLAVAALLVTSDGGTAQQAACKCFLPVSSSTWSTTDPGSHPDIAGVFNIGLGPDATPITADDTGDYNFGGVVALAPYAPTDADIPTGALVGSVNSVAVLGILNNSCANQIPVAFTFQKATTDITNTVDMLQFGIGNELAVMAGDNPPFDGVQAVKPAPVVTQYPAFLNAIFDPDWVDYGADKIPGNGDDNNGPAPAIKPRFRAAAATYIGFAQLWVILQSVVFEPGTKLPQLPALDASYGYPAVTVLQTASAAGSATPPIAGAITDFCTPLKVNTALPGVTADNPDTPANEGGVPLRTLSVDGKADSPPAAAGTPIINIGYYISQRDADGDGIENAMDPCPLNADTVWNPRDQTQPIEGDGPDTTPAGPVSDGIPDTCDPTPEATGVQPSDHDDDGFPNRGDNCPLIANKTQDDKDKNADGEEVGDGIGDACDQNPGTPDGAEITCVKISAVEVGGAPEAAVSNA